MEVVSRNVLDIYRLCWDYQQIRIINQTFMHD